MGISVEVSVGLCGCLCGSLGISLGSLCRSLEGLLGAGVCVGGLSQRSPTLRGPCLEKKKRPRFTETQGTSMLLELEQVFYPK